MGEDDGVVMNMAAVGGGPDDGRQSAEDAISGHLHGGDFEWCVGHGGIGVPANLNGVVASPAKIGRLDQHVAGCGLNVDSRRLSDALTADEGAIRHIRALCSGHGNRRTAPGFKLAVANDDVMRAGNFECVIVAAESRLTDGHEFNHDVV